MGEEKQEVVKANGGAADLAIGVEGGKVVLIMTTTGPSGGGRATWRFTPIEAAQLASMLVNTASALKNSDLAKPDSKLYVP